MDCPQAVLLRRPATCAHHLCSVDRPRQRQPVGGSEWLGLAEVSSLEPGSLGSQHQWPQCGQAVGGSHVPGFLELCWLVGTCVSLD